MKGIIFNLILFSVFITFSQNDVEFKMDTQLGQTNTPKFRKYELGILDSLETSLEKLIPEMV